MYLNWLLSKAGQSAYAKGDERPSFRVDVPKDHIMKESFPHEDDQENYREEFVRKKDEIIGFVRKILEK